MRRLASRIGPLALVAVLVWSVVAGGVSQAQLGGATPDQTAMRGKPKVTKPHTGEKIESVAPAAGGVVIQRLAQ